MPNSLPKLPPSAPAQIFIHPEHIEGTLKVPIEKKSHPNKGINIVAAFVIVGLILILAGAYYIIPRTRTVAFASSTIESVGELSGKTDKVNSSLTSLYQSLTQGQSGSAGTTQISDQVLGLQSDLSKKLSDSSLLTLSAAYEATGKTKVKAFSVPDEDPNKVTREQRSLAKEIADKKKDAEASLSEATALTNENLSGKAATLETQLSQVNIDTKDYLSEAEKTSLYYVNLSDASIELYNLSSSLVSPKDIAVALPKLTALRSSFADYDSAKLPDQMDSLNKDVVGIFDLLIGFFKEVSSGNQSEEALAASYQNFLSSAKTLESQTSVHEISFWQNNAAFSNYKNLTSSQTEVIKKAQEVKKENNFFVLSWFGVN
ncbi:MAG TPA: hypothetical protein VLE47_00345 [Candidatus Saccharimonadales bacterium]|nr:hypothetical protein [Candidatus Saccharimonadales bacterium]